VHPVVMKPDTPASGRDRVLLLIKMKGPQTAARMAKRLDVTTMAVRQHLSVLHQDGVVDYVDERRKVGRPVRVWRLTPKAYDRFQDCHAELAVGMFQAIQSAFGEEGVERLIAERMRQQIESYRGRMPGPARRLNSAWRRWQEFEERKAIWPSGTAGAMNGTIELVENHSSIDKAAPQ
jgi:predicted ArsR family transcriptional regulator